MESVEVKELFIRADNAVSGNISYAARSLGGDRGVDAVGTEAVNLVSGAGTDRAEIPAARRDAPPWQTRNLS